ncbi:MAG TPA: hypothetical protein VID96_11845 [Xanthobacteraceae bacterium]|jgi:hypothetical protein
MRQTFAIAAILAVFSAGSASSAEKSGDPGTNVEMPFLIAPMSKDGKLLGYSYISSRLVATSQSAALEIRDKIAFIQDAFVRDVNATPVATPANATTVDMAALSARLVADARRVVGAAKVSRIVFGDGDKDTGVQFAPLHPTQTPLRADQMDEVAPAAPAATPKPVH